MKRRLRRRLESWLRVTLAVLTVLIGCRAAASAERSGRPVVLVAPIRGTVDLGVAPFVARVLDEAEREGAAAVVLDIDTFGGRLDAAVAIRDRLLASPVRTVAYVNPRAISAGALIALAATELATSRGATLGAATPVMADGMRLPAAVDEKTLSYVRKEFRATAELRGRRADVAEAMVDPDVDLGEIAPKGKLLTLTADEALALGVTDRVADDLPALLGAIGLAGADVRTPSPNWAEKVVRAVTSPIVSSVLMALGITGLLVELRTPGLGVPGLVGFACLALFFGGQWLVHLAGFEELALLGVGAALLALEVFVIPGFGVAGVLGIVAIGLGLGLSLVGEGATAGAVVASLGRVAASVLAAAVAMVALLAHLPRMPFARGIVLTAGGPDTMVAVPASTPLVGATGVALTPLRPAGTAEVAGRRVDVVTEGEFIGPGSAIEVLEHEGSRVVVRRAFELDDGGPERAQRT